MESAIQKFNSTEFGQVRGVEIDGEGWLVGKDVCDILGYANASKALADHVDDEDKLNNESLSSLGQRGGWLINESGLYSLILRSNLPKAREFKRWVTSEVLPAIRSKGAFINFDHSDKAALGKMLVEAGQTILAQANKIDALTAEVAVKDQQIAEMQPKASYYDVVLSCPDAIAISIIAKDYGMSAKGLNKFLADQNIQYKQGDIWLIRAKYQKFGYTCTKTALISHSDGSQRPKAHTYWTQKGRLFLYDFLKKHNMLPLCETREFEAA